MFLKILTGLAVIYGGWYFFYWICYLISLPFSKPNYSSDDTASAGFALIGTIGILCGLGWFGNMCWDTILSQYL